MSSKPLRSFTALPRKPLATSFAAIFALSAPSLSQAATTWFVNTCDEGVSFTDGSHGSLRWALDPSRAQDGDTIDMTAIGCSTISMHTGAFNVPQNNLKIFGPGETNLTLTAEYSKNNKKYYMKDRIFNHTGTGKLSLYDMTVEKGYYKSSAGTAFGGCINSAGSVYMKHIAANLCQVLTDSGGAHGGAVAAQGAVYLKYSSVSANTANSGATGYATSGGVYAKGRFGSTAAAIKYNQATGPTGTYAGYDGGLTVRGTPAIVLASTISHNTATKRVGGANFGNILSGARTVSVWLSTISGNSSTGYVGGMYSDAAKTYIWNSTVAFNTSSKGKKGSKYYSPGVATVSTLRSLYISLKSSILSNNSYGTTEDDLSTYDTSNTTTFNGAAPNVVLATKVGGLPSGTKTGSCPYLGMLRNNGGPTLTHALMSNSIAIDTGLNALGSTVDQRLAGYVRPDVKTGLTDIGAYEVQQDDIVFTTGVDGCLALF